MASNDDKFQDITNDPRAQFIKLDPSEEEKAAMEKIAEVFLESCQKKLTPFMTLLLLDLMTQSVK